MKPRAPLLLTVALGLCVPAAHGQNVAALAEACRAVGGPEQTCLEAAVAAGALQGHLGLSASQGSEVPGSAGTLGRRLGSTPRVALSARAGFAHVAMPDLTDPAEEPSRRTSFVLPSIHAGMAVGVFDGFSPLPTVGGLLSVDLLSSASVVFFPRGQGFDGRTHAVAVGARFGLLRESFTLPGVAVSVMHRATGEVTLGTVSAGDAASVLVDPSVTAIRATVGKDLLSVGLLAGVGWDRYGGDAEVRLPSGRVGSVTSFDGTRRLYFGGASLNFLILQLSAEAGWVEGLGRVTGYQGAPFDPTAGNAFGSIAFRLTI